MGGIDEAGLDGCVALRRLAPNGAVRARRASLSTTKYALLSTETGLAAAFVIDQPPAERRIKPRTPRDAERFTGDSVSLMIDFDATGQVGYEFSVGLGGGVRDGLITNQNKFDRDWDGEWRHAVQRERRAMDRRTLHSLVDDQHARFRRRHAHDRRLCIALSL